MNYSYQVTMVPKIVFGENSILECRKHLEALGRNFAFVMGCGPTTEYATERIKKSFEGAEGLTVNFIDNNNNPINYRTIGILADKMRELEVDVAIAVGGGKTCDIVRAQASQTGTKVCLVPTIAATNACGTTMQVIFNDDNTAIEEFVVKPYHHEMTILDTDLVIKAPPRTLAAGIGDALGTIYEALLTAKQHSRDERCSSMMWSAFLDGERVLREKGLLALMAAKAGQKSLAFEQVVEHIIIGNGMFGMAANGGMSIAHNLADEVLVYLGCEERFLHGELVGYAVIPTMIWDDYPLDEIYSYVDYCLDIGIPVTLEDLGLGSITDEELMKNAVKSMDGWILRWTDVKLTAADFAHSMRTGDNLVRQYLAKKK